MQLLGYAATRQRAAGRRPGTVPAVALVVRVDPTADPKSPNTLLAPCVTLAALTHPVLVDLLGKAGAKPVRGGYQVRVPTNSAPAPAVVHALSSPHPSIWRTHAPQHRVAQVREVLGVPLWTALSDAGLEPGGSRPKRLAGMSLRVDRRGHQLVISPDVEDLTLAGHQLNVGVAGKVRLNPQRALALVAAAQERGMAVLAEDPHAWTALVALVHNSLVVEPTRAAPGWAQLVAGPGLNLPETGPLPVAEALRALDRVADSGLVAVHPQVAGVAAATAAAATPVNRPGLHSWQDTFVSTYLACGAGMVNALPPGAGKTVCAATAMSERSRSHPSYRAVVLAPATLREQWCRELRRFFPDAETLLAASSNDLHDAARRWSDATPALVVVTTPQLLARFDAPTDLACVDLVVDEATFLANPAAAATRAAWALRTVAQHAMVLTGTPSHRGLDGVGELLSFARNTPDEFAEHRYADPHPLVPQDRAGVLVFTGPNGTRESLPTASPTEIVLAPQLAELDLDQLAAARVHEALSAPRVSIPKLRTELEAWRLALASPAALLASNYALATAAREIGVQATIGAKGNWLCERAQAEAASGRQTLVFSDFSSAFAPLQGQLRAAGLVVEEITSRQHPRERERIVAAFTAGNVDVLLIAATGQLGLNLQSAATVVHLDVPWSIDTLTQRSARAARLGSRHEHVDVFVPVVDTGADQHLLAQLLAGDSVDLLDFARTLTAARAAA